MGLLKHLLFWPVTGPQFLTEFSLEKVNQVVREQLTDDQPIKEELLELQLKLESGEIDDDEYVAEEARLMQALRDVRHWREQFGMGISGGPVRVAETPKEEADEPAAEEREPQVMSGDAKVDISLDWGDQ
ncbi:MAG TPA: gas vesicle protein GvpG [Longimicrobiales bacterium]